MSDAEVISIDAHRDDRPRCRATTSSGRPCRNYAADASGYCTTHARVLREVQKPASASTLDAFIGRAQRFLRARLRGDYSVDDFGYDSQLSRDLLIPLMKPLYERYFRVRTVGIDRIPGTGPAMLVSNHSGTIPVDALVMQYAVATEHPEHRVVRNLAANLAFTMPFIGSLARKSGSAVACNDDAIQLLRRGDLVGVFPEGYKGVGKGWRERYKLQRFGRGGFIEVALRQRVPIIPVAIVGAEEAYPMIGNARFIARSFGLPYFPITPTFPLFGLLGALPLPSRWIIEFGEPLYMDEYPENAYDDAMLVFDLSDRVRDIIQQMLYRNLALRGAVFF